MFNPKTISTNDRLSFLVLEDSDNFRSLEVKYLFDHAVRVDEAHDGNEALQQLQHNLYDVILVDLNMAGMNGDEFMDHIKDNESLRDIPLIVVTGHESFDEVRKAFQNHRITAFVRKSQFFNEIPNALEKARVEAVRSQLPMRNALFKAIHEECTENHLEPYLQLKVRLIRAQGQIKAYLDSMEALARWKSKTYGGGPSGLVSPGEFIPVAEKYQLVNALDLQILKKACMNLKEWQREGLSPKPIAVNLSALQFEDDEVVKKIISIISGYDVPPELIELEITETSYFKHLDRALNALIELKNFGMSIVIDDYGEGQSSLGRLGDLLPHISGIKIDQNLVKEITRKPFKAELLDSALIQFRYLKKKLREKNLKSSLKIIVEGVEDVDVIDHLLNVYPDLIIQGFYFSRPEATSAAKRWLQESGRQEIKEKLRPLLPQSPV